jgi:hypothetical protein
MCTVVGINIATYDVEQSRKKRERDRKQSYSGRRTVRITPSKENTIKEEIRG